MYARMSTQVGFKEGVCYQKTSAFALAVLTPVLLLSHLTNLADVRFEIVELASWIAVFGAFAVGKFSQPIHEGMCDFETVCGFSFLFFSFGANLLYHARSSVRFCCCCCCSTT